MLRLVLTTLVLLAAAANGIGQTDTELRLQRAEAVAKGTDSKSRETIGEEFDKKIAALEAAQLAELMDTANNPKPEEVLNPAPTAAVLGVRQATVVVGKPTRFVLTVNSPILWRGKIDSGHFVASNTLVGSQLSVTVGGVKAGAGFYVVTFANGDISVVEINVLGSDPQPIPPKPQPDPAPEPTPQPDPPPKPDPPKPDPVTPSSLTIVVVEETADAVATRGAFLADKALAGFMVAKGHKFRVVDKDVVGADGKPPSDVRRFLEDAKQKQLPMMYLVDEKGKTRFSSPVPAKAADLQALLQKWGGK